MLVVHVKMSILVVSFVAMDRRRFVNDRIETGMLVSGVVDSSDGTIWFDQGVLACERKKNKIWWLIDDAWMRLHGLVQHTFDHIAIASFMLWLNITGVVIVDTVFECIFWWRLQYKSFN